MLAAVPNPIKQLSEGSAISSTGKDSRALVNHRGGQRAGLALSRWHKPFRVSLPNHAYASKTERLGEGKNNAWCRCYLGLGCSFRSSKTAVHPHHLIRITLRLTVQMNRRKDCQWIRLEEKTAFVYLKNAFVHTPVGSRSIGRIKKSTILLLRTEARFLLHLLILEYKA